MNSLRIFHGAAEPLTAVGKHQCALLLFLEKHKGWHSMATDRKTTRAIEGLLRRKSIAYNPVAHTACIAYAQGVKA